MFYGARDNGVGYACCDTGDDKLRSSESFPVWTALTVIAVLRSEETFGIF